MQEYIKYRIQYDVIIIKRRNSKNKYILRKKTIKHINIYQNKWIIVTSTNIKENTVKQLWFNVNKCNESNLQFFEKT